jgi:hypothetical protein
VLKQPDKQKSPNLRRADERLPCTIVTGVPAKTRFCGAERMGNVNAVRRRRRASRLEHIASLQCGMVPPNAVRALKEDGITVGTLEKMDVHNVRLEVGDVSTSVEVQAQAACPLSGNRSDDRDDRENAGPVSEEKALRSKSPAAAVHEELPCVRQQNKYWHISGTCVN